MLKTVDLGLSRALSRRLEATGANRQIITNYLNALENEIRLSQGYKGLTANILVYASEFSKNKNFKKMTKQDNLAFLDSYRRTENQDPIHSWIATRNLYLIVITRFFKWLFHPDLQTQDRPKPSCVDIAKLKRLEKSVYKPSDMWTQEDDLLFLKYCPSKRDRCYHAISRDSSCRPHELLKLRIKDVIFKMAGDRQYAEVLVNGKTGQRHIPLINSIPYLKDWLADHPQAGNSDAILLCGFNKSVGRALNIQSINYIYRRYKLEFYPKLLTSENVPQEDKVKIRELLKKKWNPYVRRHSALTEKSKVLREHVLRQHAGWSASSNMHIKYLHYFGNESNESILEAYGLKPKLEEIDRLKPVVCPQCSESNKIGSKFCCKCKMVLTYDEYTAATHDREKKQSEIESLQQELKALREQTDDRITDEMDKLKRKLDKMEALSQGWKRMAKNGGAKYCELDKA